jgi:3-oxoadipate enol-lactonase
LVYEAKTQNPYNEAGSQQTLGEYSVSRFALKDGGWLDYTEAGEGEAIVLVHGFGLDAAMWEPQWPALAASHRVIRYDLRGYGRSTQPTTPYSHVDDLLALIDFLHARPVHLVGLSMGGRVALRAVAHEPQAFRSLTLVDAAADGHVWSADWLQRWREMTRLAKTGDLKAAKQLWLQHILFAEARKQPTTADALQQMVLAYSGWHLANQDPELGPKHPYVESLSSVTVPTLVMVGELDLPDFRAIAEHLASQLPNATLRQIAQAGHMSNMEAPRRFNELLLEHLRRYGSASHKIQRLN